MHYLHKAYQEGYRAGVRRDEHCPFVGKQRDWWMAGWGDGRAGMIMGYQQSSKRSKAKR